MTGELAEAHEKLLEAAMGFDGGDASNLAKAAHEYAKAKRESDEEILSTTFSISGRTDKVLMEESKKTGKKVSVLMREALRGRYE